MIPRISVYSDLSHIHDTLQAVTNSLDDSRSYSSILKSLQGLRLYLWRAKANQSPHGVKGISFRVKILEPPSHSSTGELLHFFNTPSLVHRCSNYGYGKVICISSQGLDVFYNRPEFVRF